MNDGLFADLAATEANPAWALLTARAAPLYSRGDDLRDPFTRDTTRILHSMAYRRLKHKTQVFYNIENDHVCTRMEHVSHVESVSSAIARFLGLNAELTRAISLGHDLGHAPFGHQGETIIRALSKTYLGRDFWHERNGLRFVEKIELLEDTQNVSRNLNLTYAVRDGILSHCGEADRNGLFPRDLSVGLESFDEPGKYEAVTWEGCVVKLADKIAYVGRDIEDALTLGILGREDREALKKLARRYGREAVNTTVITHSMITDVCRNSTPANGIRLSPEGSGMLDEIKAFNYERIYRNPRLTPYAHYSELVLKELFTFLYPLCDGADTWKNLTEAAVCAPTLVSSFRSWLARYCDPAVLPEADRAAAAACDNEKIYAGLGSAELRAQAVIDFISGMTDRFAVALFGELLQFGAPL